MTANPVQDGSSSMPDVQLLGVKTTNPYSTIDNGSQVCSTLHDNARTVTTYQPTQKKLWLTMLMQAYDP